jgi:hypothetical protein
MMKQVRGLCAFTLTLLATAIALPTTAADPPAKKEAPRVQKSERTKPAGAPDAPAKKEATRVQKSERISPDGIAEYCVKLEAGQVVRYRFEAEAPLEFNIHSHQGEEVTYAVQQEAVGRIEFVDFKPQRADDWCWMWTNKNAAAADLRYTIFVSPPKPERKK